VGDLDPAQQRCDLRPGGEGLADQPLLASRFQVALFGIEGCPLEVAGPDLDPGQAPGQVLAPMVVSSLAGLLELIQVEAAGLVELPGHHQQEGQDLLSTFHHGQLRGVP
jgi:hypothetical protein